MNLISIDFEFQANAEPVYKVVCAALQNQKFPRTKTYWTSPLSADEYAIGRYIRENKDATFLAYNVQAEARCFQALGLDPMEYNWIDLMVEWKLLCNGPTKFNKVAMAAAKSPYSLLTATKGLLGIEGDKEHKDRMRKLVIDADKDDPWGDIERKGEKQNLLDYCASDVHELFKMLDKVTSVYVKNGMMKNREDLDKLLFRGRYQALTAKMTQRGILVDFPKLMEMDANNALDKRALQEKLSKEYPGLFAFRRKKDKLDPTAPMRECKKNVKDEVERLAKIHHWKRGKPTPVQIKKAEEAGEEYPKGSYTAEADMLKYAEAMGIATPILVGARKYSEQSQRFKFFSHKKGDPYWHDHIGVDWRQRPYFKTFDSSTSRNYFSSKSFLPANHNDIASCLTIPEGHYLVQLDAGQEEFILCAVRSGDDAMIEDYKTGDPYVGLAKRTGQWDGKKTTRAMFKQTVLALGFGQWITSFMWELRHALKREVTFEEAEEYYNYYWDSYSTYAVWRDMVWDEYQMSDTPMLLEDGIPLWPGKGPKHKLSVQNHPIQATGAVHIRKTHMYAEEWGVPIAFPFHDAVYFYTRIDELERSVAIVAHAFNQAWNDIFPEYPDILKVDGTVYGVEKLSGAFAVPLETKLRYSKF